MVTSFSYLSDIDSIDDTNLLEEMERALQMHIHTLKISRYIFLCQYWNGLFIN